MLGDTEQNFIEKSRITNKNFIEKLSWMGDLFDFFGFIEIEFSSLFVRRRHDCFDAVAVWTQRVVWYAATVGALKTQTR
jgi:hypothetical protein